MASKFNVWRAEIKWSRMRVSLHPKWKAMIPTWMIPPLAGEAVWRLLGGALLGIVLGLFVSSLKTLFDYLLVMYECRTVGEVKQRKF